MKHLFNDGWRFRRYDINTPVEQYIIPEAITAPVDVPHDWMIYDSCNLYDTGIGCYTKDFALTIHENERYIIMFDGVYMDSTIYINGKSAGIWKYGYTPFEFDITQYVHNGINKILVACIYKCPNSRWYSGAGIYRNCWLRIISDAALVSGGSYIVSDNTDSGWNINIKTEVELQSVIRDNASVSVTNIITDAEGIQIACNSEALKLNNHNISISEQNIQVFNPVLWDIENPYLYTVKTTVTDKDTVIDEYTQRIGLRTIKFDCNEGFFLNGKHIRINGACQHHDLGSLGSAFNLCALRRQFKKLKNMGINSIRTSHNPPAAEFMDLADEMGMLIDSEIFDMWESPKTDFDYGNYFNEWWQRDVDAWLRRDRNHPSIIMWSIGNEIYDTHQGRGLEITKQLRDRVLYNDPDRNGYITIGSNYIPWEGAQACADELDLSGYNYAERCYEEHHKKYPHWCIYGSETSSTVQSRGIYHFPGDYRLLTHDDLQCSSLGNCSTNWGAKNSAEVVINDRDTSFSMGQYIWTGWDYIGEPTPYFTKNSYFGQIDTAGFEKDTFYQYQAEWTDCNNKPMVHLLPYWSYNDGQLIDIRAYSNCPEIELFYNDVSIGKCAIDHKKGKILSGQWRLPYHDGTIKAVAYYENGEIAAVDTKKSFGDPENIILKCDRNEIYADGTDLAFIEISVNDKNNIPVENARNRIYVNVTGEGRLIGIDNGDSTDYESYKGNSRKLFSGKLLAIVASTCKGGTINVQVSSVGLSDSNLAIKSINVPGNHIDKIERNSISPTSNEVPVRQIKLTKEGSNHLNATNKVSKLSADILPANSTDKSLVWKPLTLEGIESNFAKVEGNGTSATVTALGDGEFRLYCSSFNGSDHPEVISEYEFDICGLGQALLNPYNFVSGCQYSDSNEKPSLSFKGGIFTQDTRSWVSFNLVDFGDYGSDEITIPIFSFQTELPLEIWEGNPDKDGKLILACTYKSPSWYNHYQSNTFKLPVRLKGMKTITILTTTRLSLQGFSFKQYNKAFSELCANDYSRITGDSFKIEKDAITGIGNNVSIEFANMDFGENGASRLTICGHSQNTVNTIHIRYESSAETKIEIVEFKGSENYCEQVFDIKPFTGRANISLVFLPGSKFDLKWFKFN